MRSIKTISYIILCVSLVHLSACQTISSWFGDEKKESAEPSATMSCQYQAHPESFELQWTAFKTTEKIPVKGTFTNIQWLGAVQAPSFEELLKTYSVVIDGKTVETHNPGRNATVQEYFFGEWLNQAKIEGKVLGVEGNEEKGKINIELSFNGVKKVLNFNYEKDHEGLLRAKSGFSMPDFNLQKAFNAIHEACKGLHKGPDGISKTWEEIELELIGRVDQKC
ncbi:MAG: YceI family protein [Deltaproteobacteria bacterium]|nr:YceI family protein [Deltaproteobacteria bacterium]